MDMRKQYKLFKTVIDAQAWADYANVKMGYPLDGKTLSYTEIIDHPSDGTALCVTCPKCTSIFTDEEIANLKTMEEVKALGFFPALAWW